MGLGGPQPGAVAESGRGARRVLAIEPWGLPGHMSVINGILWGRGKRGVRAEPRVRPVGGGLRVKSCTLALSSRLFPTLPPPATVIRLGVAMVTGEVT